MAEIEGRFIHLLTDTQDTYSPDIYVAVDADSFSSTRKMKVGTIYAKAYTLPNAGVINPDTTVVKVDNGSGNEAFLTVAELAANAKSSSLSFSGTQTSGHFNSLSIKGKKTGKVLQVIATWSNTEWGSSQFMKKIEGYISPGYNVPLLANDPTNNSNRISTGYIDTEGNIYFTNDEDNLSWQLNAFVIMGN